MRWVGIKLLQLLLVSSLRSGALVVGVGGRRLLLLRACLALRIRGLTAGVGSRHYVLGTVMRPCLETSSMDVSNKYNGHVKLWNDFMVPMRGTQDTRGDTYINDLLMPEVCNLFELACASKV